MDSLVEDTTTAPVIVGVSATLQITTLCLVAARVNARLRLGKSLQWHDWAIIGAEILAIPQFFLIVGATFYGYGRYTRFVAPEDMKIAMRNTFVAQVTWFYSTTLVKLSLVCLLLSLKRTSRPWITFFYISMGILGCALIPATLTQFISCRPISAYWDPEVRLTAECWEFRAIAANVIAFSVVQALSDVVFSFIPLTFIVRLQRPLRDRIIVSILMGLGLLASATAITRTVIGVTPRKDLFRTDADISLLALVDLHVAITAATLPTLKGPFEKVLVEALKAWRCETADEDAKLVLFKMGLLDTLSDEEDPSIEIWSLGKREGK